MCHIRTLGVLGAVGTAHLPYERFSRDQGVFGAASEVIDRLQAARDEFALSQRSMLARDEVERTMWRFADQVMPKLAAG
jgi:hypothetical protein